jgi:hypothetical protein
MYLRLGWVGLGYRALGVNKSGPERILALMTDKYFHVIGKCYHVTGKCIVSTEYFGVQHNILAFQLKDS